MQPIKRIPIDKLEVGMYVTEQTENLTENELRAKGFIKRDETLNKLKSKGIKELYIDVSRGKDSPFALPLESDSTPSQHKVSLKKERARAEKVYREARGIIGNIIKDVKVGNPIDVAPIEALAEDINNSVLNNPNALLCLSAIREKDKYLLEHSINVGILMGIFSKSLGYDREVVHQLVTGALLHDIGKIRVPSEILNKPGKLTPEEWIEMKRHVAYGESVLQNSQGITEIAMSICGTHHERLDGSGYPMGLKDQEISVYGRLAAIVDVYDAMTADRVYHKGKSPADAISFLLTLGDHHLDKGLVYEFIRCMSLYPVGTLVELSNGKLAVVISMNTLRPDKPLVKAFYNLRHKHHETPKEINLAKPLQDIEIVSAVDPNGLDFSVAEFI